MMEIFLYCYGSDQVEANVPVKDLPKILKDEKNFVWVDMDQPTLEDEAVLLNVFNFHPLAIEDCRVDHSQPKVEEYPEYLYFIVHGLHSEATARDFDTKELDCFLGSNYVVTYHHDLFRSINNIKQQVRASPVTCKRGGAYLLHQIIDQIVDHYSPLIEDFERSIIETEDRIFALKKADNNILAEIVLLKRNIIRLRRISNLQLDILYRLSHGEFSQIEEQMLPFYRDVYDHLFRVSDLADSYRELVSSLTDLYLSILANRNNDVVKVLTLFSAIMLPLSLIAGIYGMNFKNMPELDTQFGYYTVLCIMGVVAGGMLAYFWRKGWLTDSNDHINANQMQMRRAIDVKKND